MFVTEHGEEIANTIHTGLLLIQNLSADIAFVDDRCGIRLLGWIMLISLVTLGRVARRGDHIANAVWHLFKFLDTF